MIENLGDDGFIKFLIPGSEDAHGLLVAINKDKTVGVVLCNADSLDGQCKFGRLYVIEELKPELHPTMLYETDHVPDEPGWDIAKYS